MGDLRGPLLRPARAARGLRPHAGGGGTPARHLASAVLGLVLLAFIPQVALADTLTLEQYRTRLAVVQRTLTQARGSTGAVRASLLASAQSALRATSEVTLPSGATMPVDDASLAAIDPTDTSIDAGVARLNARITIVSRVGAPSIDAATANAKLRESVRDVATQPGSGDIFDAITRLVYRFLAGLSGPRIDFLQLLPVIGALGLAVILFILATLGRALPERVRREVLVRGGVVEARSDPAAQLHAADAALASGKAREAIHALFLYVIAALSSREVLRYDPALTDRELLARAVAIPHAESFRDLVTLYERSWFGVRDPSVDEARRARELALRVAP